MNKTSPLLMEIGSPFREETAATEWPVRKGIPSGCLVGRSCARFDKALLLNCCTKKKKKGNCSNYWATLSVVVVHPSSGIRDMRGSSMSFRAAPGVEEAGSNGDPIAIS